MPNVWLPVVDIGIDVKLPSYSQQIAFIVIAIERIKVSFR